MRSQTAVKKEYQKELEYRRQLPLHLKIRAYFKIYYIRFQWSRIYGMRWFWDSDYRIETKRKLYNQRRKVSNAQGKRERIYLRDGRTCKQCGSTDNLTLDHIIPLGEGGSSKDSNLQILCARCNIEKSKETATQIKQNAHKSLKMLKSDLKSLRESEV